MKLLPTRSLTKLGIIAALLLLPFWRPGALGGQETTGDPQPAGLAVVCWGLNRSTLARAPTSRVLHRIGVTSAKREAVQKELEGALKPNRAPQCRWSRPTDTHVVVVRYGDSTTVGYGTSWAQAEANAHGLNHGDSGYEVLVRETWSTTKTPGSGSDREQQDSVPEPWWTWWRSSSSTKTLGVDWRAISFSSRVFFPAGDPDPGEIIIFEDGAVDLDLKVAGIDLVWYANDGKARVGFSGDAAIGRGSTRFQEKNGTDADSDSPQANTVPEPQDAAVGLFSVAFFFEKADHMRLEFGRVWGVSARSGLDASQRDDSAWMFGVSLPIKLGDNPNDS